MISERNTNKEIYDAYWKSVSLFKTSSPGNRWLFDLMDEQFEYLDTDSVKSILDVGCGDGSKVCFLKTRFKEAHILGIDFSLAGIESARRRVNSARAECYQNIEFKCLDANDTTIWKEKFDMLTCFEVLEHVDDWKALADKFTRSANQYILLSFPTGRMRKWELSAGHVRNFQKNEVENYLAGHNFHPIVTYYAGFPFLNPIGRDMLSIFYKFYHQKILTVNEPNLITRVYSNLFYFLFKYCSTKYHFGNQFLGLFKRSSR